MCYALVVMLSVFIFSSVGSDRHKHTFFFFPFWIWSNQVQEQFLVKSDFYTFHHAFYALVWYAVLCNFSACFHLKCIFITNFFCTDTRSILANVSQTGENNVSVGNYFLLHEYVYMYIYTYMKGLQKLLSYWTSCDLYSLVRKWYTRGRVDVWVWRASEFRPAEGSWTCS